MSSQTTLQSYIVQEDGVCGGRPRIASTRLKVQHIALEYDRLGWTPDQICDAHPGISLAQVHAAISYYYDHKEEIDKTIREDLKFVELLRKELRDAPPAAL
ncbi:MAG: DUF433 domain-containing protein [Candidatus Latescibacteria bacterium]|nr:DUF433 domain-containing protein [Candidatus Latescibacterota bacterium]